MTTIRLFISFTAILVVALATHLYAEMRDLYFYIWWFDIPMHFFGGAGVGVFGLWVAKCFGVTLAIRGRPLHSLWTVGIVVAVAIVIIAPAWEVFEVYLLSYMQRPLPAAYMEDTTLDLILGGLGAITMWAAFCRVQLKHVRQ